MSRNPRRGFDLKHPLSGWFTLTQPLPHSLWGYSTYGRKSGLSSGFIDGDREGTTGSLIHGNTYKAFIDGLSRPCLLLGGDRAVKLGAPEKTCLMPPIANRLAEALARSGKTQAQIAKRLGVTPQAVNAWMKTGRISKGMLAKFAREVGVGVEELITGVTSNVTRLTGINTRKVPRISWVQAGNKKPVADPYQPGVADTWEETTVDVSDVSFALMVRGDSMVAPDGSGFPEGSILIVDPMAEARNGDYVVVRFNDSNEATFKRLVFDGPLRLLRPLNPAYPTMQITEDAQLAGVVVEVNMRRRFR